MRGGNGCEATVLTVYVDIARICRLSAVGGSGRVGPAVTPGAPQPEGDSEPRLRTQRTEKNLREPFRYGSLPVSSEMVSYWFEAFALPRPFCLAALGQDEEEQGGEEEEGGRTHPGFCWECRVCGQSWSQNTSLAKDKKKKKKAEVNVIVNGTQLEFTLCKRWEPEKRTYTSTEEVTTPRHCRTIAE